MHTFVSRALTATLFTGGLMLLGAGVANAAESTGDDGILSGTQLGISIDLPVTIGGDALSVIGDSASTDAAAAATADDDASWEPVAVTSGDDGIGSGSQAIVDVSVPITISGNAVSVGDSTSDGATTIVGTDGGGADVAGDSDDAGGARTSGEDAILGGTQALIDVDAPVTVSGNAVSVIGDSTSEGATTVVTTRDGTGSTGGARTSGEDAILGGTQVLPDLTLPITIGGNAVSVIGDSTSEGATTVVIPGGPTEPGDPGDPSEPGDPGDPSEPGRPGHPSTPGGGHHGGHDGAVPMAAPMPSAAVAPVSAGTASLASTGVDAGFWERLALLLVVTGGLLVGIRRFALRR
ncbi:hypothetical protein GCM10009819_18890 [Agromyces tropicus]|uniref:DUF320 domain-containing protein n=1 Tax=Agromyces tropicus TaxID=555371 RepID=A0ABP5FXL1_9MICO